MINPEREMLVCCAKVLLDLQKDMDLIEAKRWVCDMLSREETPNEFLPKPPPPFETVEDLEE